MDNGYSHVVFRRSLGAYSPSDYIRVLFGYDTPNLKLPNPRPDCVQRWQLCDSRSQPQARGQCGFGINFKVDPIGNLVVVSLISGGMHPCETRQTRVLPETVAPVCTRLSDGSGQFRPGPAESCGKILPGDVLSFIDGEAEFAMYVRHDIETGVD